jgi:hypothetical protein
VPRSSYLSRFRIVKEAMCVYLKDYKTVDHLIWHRKRFEIKRRRLTDALTALDVQHGTLLELEFDDLGVLFQG